MIRTRRIRQGLLKIRISLDQLLVKAAFEVAKFLFKRGIILGTVYTILETRREWKTIKKTPANRDITTRGYSLS